MLCILSATDWAERHAAVACALILCAMATPCQDEFYNRYLVRQKLFEPVFQVFLANGGRYNLLNSTVLELCEFIRKVGL